MKKKTRMPRAGSEVDWEAEARIQAKARQRAGDLLSRIHLLEAPVDPLAVAASEKGLVKCVGDDFEGAFDGRLEFHPSKDRFLLLYNTRYDRLEHEGEHHPRTRFSIAHELGHYFTDRHYAFMRRGGKVHGSRSEYLSKYSLEREADAFASGLLMPTKLIKPMVNSGELDLDQIQELAKTFRTSFVSTTIRAVELSNFPCAVVGVRDEKIAWTRRSIPVGKNHNGAYPKKNGSAVESESGKQAWREMLEGGLSKRTADAPARCWFQLYRDHLEDVVLTEHFLPVPVMNTLVVLLTLSEGDFFGG